MGVFTMLRRRTRERKITNETLIAETLYFLRVQTYVRSHIDFFTPRQLFCKTDTWDDDTYLYFDSSIIARGYNARTGFLNLYGQVLDSPMNASNAWSMSVSVTACPLRVKNSVISMRFVCHIRWFSYSSAVDGTI